MMKWLWALIALFAFAAAWQAATPGMLGLWLLLGIVATVASFLGFLSDRVGSVAGAQMHRESALLATVAGGAKRPATRDRDGAATAAFGATVAYGATRDEGHPAHDDAVRGEFGGTGDGGSDSGGSDGGGDGGGGGD